MLYDGLLRVPCLVQGPGIQKGLVLDDPVGTIDILATATDLCNITTTPGHGRSWRALWNSNATRDFALAEYEVDAVRSAVDMDLMTVRTRRYRLSIDLRTNTGELYDLQEDPDEMDNLFDDAARSAVRVELVDMIRSRPSDQIPAYPRVGWH